MTRNDTPMTVDRTTTDAVDLDQLARRAPATDDLLQLADWLAAHGPAHLSAIARIELAEQLITRRRFLIGAGALGLGVITGCGPGEQAAAPTATLATRTVDTRYGPVDLPANPQRVLPRFYAVMDYALVLNLPLVARTGFGYNSVAAYQQTAYPDVLADLPNVTTSPEINYEQIAALQPDCIIEIATGFDAERYQLLAAIAPTFSLSPTEAVEGLSAGRPTWRGTLRTIAQTFGRESTAERVIAAYATRAAALRARLAARWADATFAVLQILPESLVIHGREAAHQHQILFTDLGLRPAPFLTPDPQFGVSFETLPEVDADVLLLPLSPQPGSIERDRTPLNDIQTNPLWQQLPAVAQDQVYAFPIELGYPTPLTATAFLDFVEQTLLGGTVAR
ncbi:MAG: ABC transporter substrate-binding protein [Chloroflexales bacterium]|nr:ABC transporter substrate-binding protein [Chloroflexales bacterium]